MIAPNSVYPKPTETIIVVFDVRIPGTAERLHSERAAWGEHGGIEALDGNHFVLVVRSGGTRRLAK